MTIVICEDNKDELNALAEKVRRYFQEIHVPCEVLTYNNSNQLWFEIDDQEQADLYILDIDMPGYSGVDIAEKIRKTYPNPLVIFYTMHNEYATDGYRIGIRRYLIKGRPDTELYEALLYAKQVADENQNDCIVVESPHENVRVPVSEIMYVRYYRRATEIHTRKYGILHDSRGINVLYKALNRPYFVFIDKGTIVNAQYVFKIGDQCLVLYNQEELPISRRRMTEVRNAILKTWKEM